MNHNTEKILEKMYGKVVTRAKVNLGKGQEQVTFDIHEGYETCENQNGQK